MQLEGGEKAVGKEVIEEAGNKFEIHKVLRNKIGKSKDIFSIKFIRLGTLELSWLFGMSFDDHEDTFVTLFNKNFSKQILS